MTECLTSAIDLPKDFRVGDVLAFHKRDPSMLSERVGSDRLQKGMVWNGQATCLIIVFADRQAHARLTADGPTLDTDPATLEEMARRMLGLNQPVEEFERQYCDHPQAGRLIARTPGLRIPLTATPFEALIWAITGQQITLTAAISLRRKLIDAAGVRHSDGLACHPDASTLARMGEAQLREIGFSEAKARALMEVSRQVESGALPLDAWTRSMPIEQMHERMLAVRGIGPWTISYTLLRGFGWLDGSLHGDAAVRRGLRAFLGMDAKISENDAKAWLAPFSPWRALIAAHLWGWESAAHY